VPLLSLDVIRSTWNAMGSWTSAEADRGAKRFVDRQPIVNAAVLALTEDAGEDVASIALYCACAIAECYEAARGRALPRVRERIMDEALEGMERWGRDLERMEEQLFARRALYGRDHDQPYLVAELIRYLIDATDEGELDGEDLGIIFSVLLAVIRAFDRVSGVPRRVPSMEQVLKELTGRPLPCLYRLSPCPCGSGRRYRECCLRKRGPASARNRLPARLQ
jgi:SEC-C motif-containing protein